MSTTTLARFVRSQWTVAVNVLAPIVTYQLGTARGLSEMQALLLAAAFPLASVSWNLSRTRRVEPIGAISALAIVVGGTIGLLLNDPRVLLVKESLVTGGVGIACLASLLTDRPLLGLLATRFGTPRERLGDPQAQVIVRHLTVIWGLAFIGEAGTRVALSFLVAPGVLVIVSPILAAVAFGPLFVWTTQQARSARQAFRRAASV